MVQQRRVDMIALDEALDKLAQLDPRQSRIVELRFFGGLTEEEIADVLGVSGITVKRDWRIARAVLHRQLGSAAFRPDRAAVTPAAVAAGKGSSWRRRGNGTPRSAAGFWIKPAPMTRNCARMWRRCWRPMRTPVSFWQCPSQSDRDRRNHDRSRHRAASRRLHRKAPI